MAPFGGYQRAYPPVIHCLYDKIPPLIRRGSYAIYDPCTHYMPRKLEECPVLDRQIIRALKVRYGDHWGLVWLHLIWLRLVLRARGIKTKTILHPQGHIGLIRVDGAYTAPAPDTLARAQHLKTLLKAQIARLLDQIGRPIGYLARLSYRFCAQPLRPAVHINTAAERVRAPP